MVVASCKAWLHFPTGGWASVAYCCSQCSQSIPLILFLKPAFLSNEYQGVRCVTRADQWEPTMFLPLKQRSSLKLELQHRSSSKLDYMYSVWLLHALSLWNISKESFRKPHNVLSVIQWSRSPCDSVCPSSFHWESCETVHSALCSHTVTQRDSTYTVNQKYNKDWRAQDMEECLSLYIVSACICHNCGVGISISSVPALCVLSVWFLK